MSFGRPFPYIRLDRQNMFFTARCCECYNSALTGGRGISRVIGMLLWAITLIMDAEQKEDLDDFGIKLRNSSCNNNNSQLHFLNCWMYQAPHCKLSALIFPQPWRAAGLFTASFGRMTKLMFKRFQCLHRSPVAHGWRNWDCSLECCWQHWIPRPRYNQLVYPAW